MTENPISPQTGTVPEAQRLSTLLRGILLRPQQLLLLWNWKSALLSLIMRGPIFFVAGLQRGWQGGISSLLTESIFCASSTGFYGAVIQILKDAEPEWLTGIFLVGALPLTFQMLEYGLHWIRGTPHLRAAAIASLVACAVATTFNWYAMRRGALLVGQGAEGFERDLYRMPRLVLGFIVALPHRFARRLKPRSPGFRARSMSDDQFRGR